MLNTCDCLQFEADKDSKDAAAMARIIFDSALLESGYPIENPKEFNTRIYELLARSMNIKKDVTQGAEFDRTLSQVHTRAWHGCTGSQIVPIVVNFKFEAIPA